MFHRVEDWRQLPSPRYFLLAERLVHYQGAVRAMLLADVQPHRQPAATVPDSRPPEAPGEPVTMVDDIATLAAMSQQPGFPSIGYSGEG